MISPDDALVRVLALAEPVEIETVPLLQAAGRWAVEPIIALREQPARALSAMDGYAVRYSDLPGAWQVIGESAAGFPYAGSVAAKQATRISTGAAVPDGCDTIIIQEDVVRNEDTLSLTGKGPQAKGEHVRTAGSDFSNGQTLVDAGEMLTPARIGLAAIGGYGALAVRRRLRVAIISTGDELVQPGMDPGTDRLPASNGVMLAAMLGALPVEVTDFGIVRDDYGALFAAFVRVADYDIVVTTGGASVGDHDLVQPALIGAGATIDFWKIALRPGKPLMAGRLGKAVVIGLPGNPVSAFVTAILFLKPLMAHMLGAKYAAPTRLTATLAVDMPAVGARTDYVRARWVDGRVTPLPSDSGMLMPLAAAGALMIRPALAPAASIGATIEIIPLT